MDKLPFKRFVLVAILVVCGLVFWAGLARTSCRPHYFRLLALNESASVMQIRPSHIGTSELSIDRQCLVHYHEIMGDLAIWIANFLGEPEISFMDLERARDRSLGLQGID